MLHTLYHTYKVIRNMLKAFPKNAPKNILDKLIQTLTFFSELSERIVPISPFLLDTACWTDC